METLKIFSRLSIRKTILVKNHLHLTILKLYCFWNSIPYFEFSLSNPTIFYVLGWTSSLFTQYVPDIFGNILLSSKHIFSCCGESSSLATRYCKAWDGTAWLFNFHKPLYSRCQKQYELTATKLSRIKFGVHESSQTFITLFWKETTLRYSPEGLLLKSIFECSQSVIEVQAFSNAPLSDWTVPGDFSVC